MFVANPDPFLLPSFRISPFRTQDMAFNNHLGNDGFATDYFDNRFAKKHWQYTHNGREAIKIALENYKLEPNDVVTILTTSQNVYISSCVTSTIAQFCQWNREITPDTKVILVNHEFGYPYAGMDALVATGIPIIEDCCTTFFSQDDQSKVGKYGDYAVYSFPKFFPIQIGGLIVSNQKEVDSPAKLTVTQVAYLDKVLSHHLKNETQLLDERRQNFNYAVGLFAQQGFSERFEMNDKIIPSALLLNNHAIVKDLNQLKVFLNAHGIQNSVFYGEDAFFLPTHQNLDPSDYDYFWNCINRLLQSEI
jgi:DegT/DnrJ/EryC1/StrS aminotransferase family